MPDIYEFMDYRDFLNRWLEGQREGRPWLSWRYLGHRLQMDASSVVKIFQKQRHFPLARINTLASVLKLDEAQAKYLEGLLRFARARTPAEEKELLERLQQLRQWKIPQIKGNQLRYYDRWYYSAVRAWLTVQPFFDSYDNLGKCLHPPISEKEAEEAITVLRELNFISQGSNGQWEVNDAYITGGGGLRAEAVRRFQREAILLGERALLEDSPEWRDISSLTVSLPRSMLPIIKENLGEFRRNLLKMISEQSEADCVYQLNLQWIPLSRMEEK